MAKFWCCHFSLVRLFATPWAVARLASLSMGLSMQEHWSGLPCPSPEDLPDPGIESVFPVAPALQADFFTAEPQHLVQILSGNTCHIGPNAFVTVWCRDRHVMWVQSILGVGDGMLLSHNSLFSKDPHVEEMVLSLPLDLVSIHVMPEPYM